MCSMDIISCPRAQNYDVDFSSCTALRDQGHFLQKLVYLDVLHSRMYANYSLLCLYPKESVNNPRLSQRSICTEIVMES